MPSRRRLCYNRVNSLYTWNNTAKKGKEGAIAKSKKQPASKKPKKVAVRKSRTTTKKPLESWQKLLMPYNPPPQDFLDTLPIPYKRHKEWFMSLDDIEYQLLLRMRSQRELNIEIPNHDNYDDWLNYFKHLPAKVINQIAVDGEEYLTVEAFAAVKRWADIIENPQRIEKLHQSGLTNSSGERKSMVVVAASNNRLDVLYALRDRLAEQLEKGTGARDTASLARELGDILEQIHDAERRTGPAKNTRLAKLLDGGKRERDNGARSGSYKSRLKPKTIDDVE